MESPKLLLGNIGDNTWLLWEGLRNKFQAYDNTFFGLKGISDYNPTSEPIIIYPFLFLSKFINAIDLWNIFIILFLFLNILFSYLYFNKIINSKFLAVISSIVFVSNSYFSLHSRDHLTLMCVFILPIFLLLNKIDSNRNIFYKYLFLFISAFISNYLTTFLILLNFIDSLITYISNKNKLSKTNLLVAALSIIVSSTFVRYFFPQLSKNIDNFLIFSFKPWHLITQSPRAFINITDFEKYYPSTIWFQYFDAEHSVSYFGFIILTIFFIQLIRKKFTLSKNMLLLIFLLIFSLPPFIVIKGTYFYLPSYIFYELFPAFRIIARLNIFTFFFLISVILESLKDEVITIKKKVIFLIVGIVAALEISVPFKISTIKDNRAFEYLRNSSNPEKQIIFYPSEPSNKYLVEMNYFKTKVINPLNYESGNFNAKEFTKNLSCTELDKYKINPSNAYIMSSMEYDSIQDIKLSKVSEDIKENIYLYEIKCQQ